MKTISLEQSLTHVAKMDKWLALTPIQRLEILNKVNASRPRPYKTLSAALNSCLKLV